MQQNASIDEFLECCSVAQRNVERSEFTGAAFVSPENTALPTARVIGELLNASLLPENSFAVEAHRDVLLAWLCNFPEKLLRSKSCDFPETVAKQYFPRLADAIRECCISCVDHMRRGENVHVSFVAKLLSKLLLLRNDSVIDPFITLVNSQSVDYKWRRLGTVLQSKLSPMTLPLLIRALAFHCPKNTPVDSSEIFACFFGTTLQTTRERTAFEACLLKQNNCNGESFSSVCKILIYLSSLNDEHAFLMHMAHMLLTQWSDSWCIREAPISSQIFLTASIIKTFDILTQKPLSNDFLLQILGVYRAGINIRLTSCCLRTRTIGMCLAERLSANVFCRPDNVQLDKQQPPSNSANEALKFEGARDESVVDGIELLLNQSALSAKTYAASTSKAKLPRGDADDASDAVISPVIFESVESSATAVDEDDDDFAPIGQRANISSQPRSLKQFRAAPHYLFQIKDFLESEDASHPEKLHAHLVLLVKALENEPEAVRCCFDELFQLLNHVQIPEDSEVTAAINELRMAALVRMARCDYRRAANTIITHSLSDVNYSLGMKSRMLALVRAIASDRPPTVSRAELLQLRPLIEEMPEAGENVKLSRLQAVNAVGADDEEPAWKKTVQSRIIQNTRIKSSRLRNPARNVDQNLAPDVFSSEAHRFLFQLSDVNPSSPHAFNGMPALKAEWLITVAEVLRHAKHAPQFADMLQQSVALFYSYRADDEPCVRQAVYTGMAVAFSVAPATLLFSNDFSSSLNNNSRCSVNNIIEWLEGALMSPTNNEKHDECRAALQYAAAIAYRKSREFLKDVPIAGAGAVSSTRAVSHVNAAITSSPAKRTEGIESQCDIKMQAKALKKINNFLP